MFITFAKWLLNVCELTRDVCETTVGETTRLRNDRRSILFTISVFIPLRVFLCRIGSGLQQLVEVSISVICFSFVSVSTLAFSWEEEITKLSEFSVYKWRRKYRDVLYACFCICFVTVTPRSELALNSKKTYDWFWSRQANLLSFRRKELLEIRLCPGSVETNIVIKLNCLWFKANNSQLINR